MECKTSYPTRNFQGYSEILNQNISFFYTNALFLPLLYLYHGWSATNGMKTTLKMLNVAGSVIRFYLFRRQRLGYSISVKLWLSVIQAKY